MMRKWALATTALALSATAAAAQPWGYGRGDYGVQGGELVLYEHTYFQGRPVTLRGPEPNLVPLGFNDVASSARSRGSWEVCEHVGFQGRCWRIGGDEPDFVRMGFNDTISSARPLGGRDDRRDRRRGVETWGDPHERGGRDPNEGRDDRWGGGRDSRRGGDPIVLFEHAGFGGRSAGINGDLSNLNAIGFNDRASSVQVNAGAWRLCSDAYGQGRCVVVDRDADLTSLGLNDQVSFVGRVR